MSYIKREGERRHPSRRAGADRRCESIAVAIERRTLGDRRNGGFDRRSGIRRGSA